MKAVFTPFHRELSVLIYLGVILIIAGAGSTVKQYFSRLGDPAIIAVLTLCPSAAGCIDMRFGYPYAAKRKEISDDDLKI